MIAIFLQFWQLRIKRNFFMCGQCGWSGDFLFIPSNIRWKYYNDLILMLRTHCVIAHPHLHAGPLRVVNELQLSCTCTYVILSFESVFKTLGIILSQRKVLDKRDFRTFQKDELRRRHEKNVFYNIILYAEGGQFFLRDFAKKRLVKGLLAS